MGDIKKKQHYVWRKYLEPWTENGKIWCKRGDSIFPSSLMGIANETYFYKVNELNETEKELLSLLIKMFPEENMPVITGILERYDVYSWLSEKSQKNGLEDYHSFMENEYGCLLSELYKRDLSFFNDDFIKANFCRFLGLQYTRTKKMLISLKNIYQYLPTPDLLKGKFNPENISRIMLNITAESIGNWIYEKGNIYFFESDYELITGDQPIINVRASDDIMRPTKRTEIYYPLTPHLAIYITDRNISDRILKKEDAMFYNNHITNKAHEQVYARIPDLF